MMVRKIGQVEKDIAHAGIFPIQHIQIIIQKEIRIEQIIVTRPVRHGTNIQSLPGRLHAFDQRIKFLGKCNLITAGNISVISNYLKNIKGTRKIRQAVNFMQYSRNPAEVFRFAHLIRQNWMPGDKTGYQIAFRPDKVKHFRSNAQLAGSQIGCIFNLPVNPQ